MYKCGDKLNFNDSMKSLLIVLCILSTVTCFAQEKPIEGIIIDKINKERLAKVNVTNTRSGKSVYNSLKGEFSIDAQIGDVLIFKRQDYHNDTLRVKSFDPLVVDMAQLAIQLREVTIHDTLQSPEKRLEATKRDYSKIYGSLAYSNGLTVTPGVGAGISIDALWNSLSRSGRNATHLRGIIEQDYRQTVIDYRFNKTLVASVTKLKEPQLTDFMYKYRPGYYLVVNASDYEFIIYIRNSLRRYQRSPRNFTLPQLNVGK
jgi:ASC-1-like (ASCH) protein